MYKIARVTDSAGLKVARNIMEQIRQECPAHWPYGLSADHFDGGCYLIREKQSSVPVGFCGFQKRAKRENGRLLKVGYYSIGILPAYRKCGFAKQAVSKLLAMKAASVDKMEAMIVAGNTPSLALAESLGVPAVIKSARYLRPI